MIAAFSISSRCCTADCPLFHYEGISSCPSIMALPKQVSHDHIYLNDESLSPRRVFIAMSNKKIACMRSSDIGVLKEFNLGRQYRELAANRPTRPPYEHRQQPRQAARRTSYPPHNRFSHPASDTRPLVDQARQVPFSYSSIRYQASHSSGESYLYILLGIRPLPTIDECYLPGCHAMHFYADIAVKSASVRYFQVRYMI